MQRLDDSPGEDEESLTSFTVKVPDELYRAYQRCTWIMINETGKNQLEIMNEMVRDFLKKNGC